MLSLLVHACLVFSSKASNLKNIEEFGLEESAMNFQKVVKQNDEESTLFDENKLAKPVERNLKSSTIQQSRIIGTQTTTPNPDDLLVWEASPEINTAALTVDFTATEEEIAAAIANLATVIGDKISLYDTLYLAVNPQGSITDTVEVKLTALLKVQDIDISNQISQERLPNMGLFVELVSLNVENTRLYALPPSLFLLNKLTTVIAGGNKITAIPESIENIEANIVLFDMSRSMYLLQDATEFPNYIGAAELRTLLGDRFKYP